MIHKIQFYGINDSRIQKLFIVISKNNNKYSNIFNMYLTTGKELLN